MMFKEREWMTVMEMPLWKGQEDVSPSLRANGRAFGRGASAGSKAWEAAEGWFKGGGDACPVHSTAQNPCQDVMAQREMCSKGGASHAVVGVRAVVAAEDMR
jgi:hypothetical protein